MANYPKGYEQNFFREDKKAITIFTSEKYKKNIIMKVHKQVNTLLDEKKIKVFAYLLQIWY